jgi:hypothetical protein
MRDVLCLPFDAWLGINRSFPCHPWLATAAPFALYSPQTPAIPVPLQPQGAPLANPNALAYLMLGLWPLVAYVLYTRLDPARALIWALLAGYLLLPPLTAFNLPAVPDLDKYSIPSLMALALAVFLLKDRIPILPDNWLGRAFMVMFVVSPFATVLGNPEPIAIVEGDVPGLTLYDSVAAVSNQAIALLPYFLARRYLATPEALRAVVLALIAAGLAYSLPMLVEARLSPQINIWVYGFFQHDFFQTVRFGGYRPVVFLPHGLWVAFFALMCLIAALVMLRQGPAPARPRQLVIATYLLGVLVICKSAGALLYGLALAPVLLLAGRRVQVLLAAALAVVVVTYPMLRGAGLIPVDDIVALAQEVSPERAASLQFRIDNENALLARAQEKPWFGWGGYGRNLILDPVTGQARTIADGAWIIALGTYGWLGYLVEYGLLSLPLILLAREALARQGAAPLSPFAAGLALMLAANMVDMLPNATLIPFTWALAGALLGYAEALARARRGARAAAWRKGLHAGPPARTVI